MKGTECVKWWGMCVWDDFWKSPEIGHDLGKICLLSAVILSGLLCVSLTFLMVAFWLPVDQYNMPFYLYPGEIEHLFLQKANRSPELHSDRVILEIYVQWNTTHWLLKFLSIIGYELLGGMCPLIMLEVCSLSPKVYDCHATRKDGFNDGEATTASTTNSLCRHSGVI